MNLHETDPEFVKIVEHFTLEEVVKNRAGTAGGNTVSGDPCHIIRLSGT